MVISRDPIETGLDFLEKTLIRTPYTKTTSNISGDEILTAGTPVTIKGVFYRRVDVMNPDRPGLFDGADAVLLIKYNMTMNLNDKITYDGQDYRIEKPPVMRTLGATQIFKRCDCFKI